MVVSIALPVGLANEEEKKKKRCSWPVIGGGGWGGSLVPDTDGVLPGKEMDVV
jgi:hypothetical protein